MTQSNRQARRAWAKRLRNQAKPGRVFHVEYRHDADCMMSSSERVCTCSPDRILTDDNGNVLARCIGGPEFDPLELVGRGA